MDLLLILTYGAICIVVFKVFKIELNKWTVPTAVLGGVVLIGALILLMNYNHPYTEVAREYYITTPIIPTVKGRVTEVDIQPEQRVMQGDLLFKVDPEPYRLAVDGLTARLDAAKKDLVRSESLLKKGSISARTVDQARALVDELEAQLNDAKYELKQTEVRAPANGHVTQLTLRPGMMAMPINLNPTMTFIHDSERRFVGWFRQNSLLRIKPGDEAEIALDAIPGKVFEGRVEKFVSALGQGQLQPTATIYSFNPAEQPGRVAVVIEITDPDFEPYRNQLPAGLFGQAALYSEHFHHVSVMRKILLRMSGWMNYVFPFH